MPFLFIMLIAVVLYWHLLGGIYGPAAVIGVASMVLYAILVPQKFRGYALIVYASLMCSIVIMQVYITPISLDESTRQSAPINFVLIMIGLGITVHHLKKRYEIDRMNILLKNSDLKSMNDEMNRINANLEKIVQERTEILERKNKQLTDYAHLNAHLLRAPVSRISGLLSILKHEENHSENYESVIRRLMESGRELESITHEMSHKLNEEILSETTNINNEVRKDS